MLLCMHTCNASVFCDPGVWWATEWGKGMRCWWRVAAWWGEVPLRTLRSCQNLLARSLAPPPHAARCPLLLSTQSKKILVVLTNVSQMGDHADKKVCAPVPTYQLAPQRRMRLCDVCVTNRRFARCSLW